LVGKFVTLIIGYMSFAVFLSFQMFGC